ncbi:PepSY domain-containing protein [Methyloceanibacter sp.]|uniref:PepSY domain-containing protein n=1 Tax=Methyloceanibacter sp. TaxID=1965321 RepID=UPI003D6D95C6
MVLQTLTLRLAMLGLMATVATGASAYDGQELAGSAKIKIDDARAIALKARQGTISSEELEKEKGGSGLRYSFVVKSGKTLYEVGVDAETGKLLENAKEGANPD